MRLLIVEDDKALADGLKTILENEGYQIDVVYNGNDGCDYIITELFDLAILDINLPGTNGYLILEYMNENNIHTPVILLTAKTDIDDKLRGFSAGAVDYITKPFDIRELIARVKLRVKNNVLQTASNYSVGDLFLNPSNYTINCNYKQLVLCKKEYFIMEQLILNPGTIQTRDKLISKVWGFDDQVEYRTLDVYISMLRKKLRYIGSTAKISTKRSVGYYISEVDVYDI